MPEVTASSSISMPQSEAAPSSPSAASTTPLPEPISSTLASRTLAAFACSTWIRAAVYSLGRKAASASSDEVSDTSLGFDTSITPKTHFPGTVPTNALRKKRQPLLCRHRPLDQRRRNRIVGKLRQYLAVAARCQSVVFLDQGFVGEPRQLAQPLGR